MFGFFQFGQPQFGDAPVFASTPIVTIPVVGLGIMYNGNRKKRHEENDWRMEQEMRIENTLLAFLNTQEF